MARLFGVMRKTAMNEHEFLARETTSNDMQALWTPDKDAALQVNTSSFAARMAERFGGDEVTLRGSLIPLLRPKTECIVLSPEDHCEILTIEGKVWAQETRQPLSSVWADARKRALFIS